MNTHTSSVLAPSSRCGFAVVVALAASGCTTPPDWAEQLSADEVTQFSETLSRAEGHLPLVSDVLDRTEPFFTEDGSDPTGEHITPELQTSLDVGRDMLNAGRIFVYRGDVFPDDTENVSEAQAFANIEGGYMVFLASSLSDEANVMHELSHIVHPDFEHDEEVTAETDNQTIDDMASFVDSIRKEKDYGYRDWLTFALAQRFDFVEQVTEGKWYTQTQPDMTYDEYVHAYETMQQRLHVVQDREEWGAYVAEDSADIFADFEGIGISHDEYAEIFALPSTDSIYEVARLGVRQSLQELQSMYPEYGAQYRQEHLAVQKQELHEVHRRYRNIIK